MSERTAEADAENLYISDNSDQLRELGDDLRNKHKNLPPNTGNETEKVLIKTVNNGPTDGYRDDQRSENPDEEPPKTRGLKDLIE
jgi:hypothetical protein